MRPSLRGFLQSSLPRLREVTWMRSLSDKFMGKSITLWFGLLMLALLLTRENAALAADLLVTDASGTSSTIHVYDAVTGQWKYNFGNAASDGLKDPNGMAIGKDGLLYVSCESTNKILRYIPATQQFVDTY